MHLKLLCQYNLAKRLAVALMGLPLLVSSLVVGPWGYFACLSLLSQLTLREFYRMLHHKQIYPSQGWGAGLLAFIHSLSFARHLGYDNLYFMVASASVALPGLWIVQLHRRAQPQSFVPLAYTILGLGYIGVPFVLLHQLAFWHQQYHYKWVLLAFILVWVNDSGAFFVGTQLGRHKLLPQVSPKKTWEGFFGGLFFTIGSCSMLPYWIPGVPLGWALSLGAVAAIMGTYGDLAASSLKRSMQVKDTGSLLPGHGGFLDRFDSFLFVIPLLYLALCIAWQAGFPFAQ